MGRFERKAKEESELEPKERKERKADSKERKAKPEAKAKTENMADMAVTRGTFAAQRSWEPDRKTKEWHLARMRPIAPFVAMPGAPSSVLARFLASLLGTRSY